MIWCHRIGQCVSNHWWQIGAILVRHRRRWLLLGGWHLRLNGRCNAVNLHDTFKRIRNVVERGRIDGLHSFQRGGSMGSDWRGAIFALDIDTESAFCFALHRKPQACLGRVEPRHLMGERTASKRVGLPALESWAPSANLKVRAGYTRVDRRDRFTCTWQGGLSGRVRCRSGCTRRDVVLFAEILHAHAGGTHVKPRAVQRLLVNRDVAGRLRR